VLWAPYGSKKTKMSEESRIKMKSHYRKRFAVLLLPLLALLLFAANQWVSAATDSVCAEVKIEIKQELSLERQGFDAHMRINNGGTGVALDNVAITVNFTDAAGAAVVASSDPNSAVTWVKHVNVGWGEERTPT
jgi:hypothetical protein